MAVIRLAETMESAETTGTQAAMSDRRTVLRDDIRAEIDDILEVAKTLDRLEPDLAMMYCSGFLARLTEIWVRIIRVEHVHRELKSVRTQEVAPTLELVRDLYKIASRMITIRQQDVDLSR